MNKSSGNHKHREIPSELRMDTVSLEWVVVAVGRAKRPEEFRQEEAKKVRPHADHRCVFCNLEKNAANEMPVLILSHGKTMAITTMALPDDWTIVVLPNKFPVFTHEDRNLHERHENHLYTSMHAVGFHEVVVFRDHFLKIEHMEVSQIKEIIDAYAYRYRFLMKEEAVTYISIFHNSGPAAGASVAHPHSQIITTPLIHHGLRQALVRSQKYYQKNHQCVYCQMNALERKLKTRVVFENENFLAVCPFAPKTAFEVIISPKKHLPYFERSTEQQKWDLAEAFQVVFKKLDGVLNGPDYNFFLHTAPCDRREYDYYHWHWTILPKTVIPAGFELATRIDVSIIRPEDAAKALREH